MSRSRPDLCALVVSLLVSGLTAQQQAPQPTPLLQEPAQATPQFKFDGAFTEYVTDHDYSEQRVGGGFRFTWPALGLEIDGQSGILLTDRDDVTDLLRRDAGRHELPQRGIAPPQPRRRVTSELLRQRLQGFLAAMGRTQPLPQTRAVELATSLPRFLYFEGDVIVIQRGVEVARAARLWISPLDDRMQVEGAELRYATTTATGQQQLLTVRGKRLLKQGSRWTGRNIEVSSCDAGVPHIAMFSGEVEIIERQDQFEVISRDNHLRFTGRNLVPIPDAHFFTGEQSEIPLKGASASYSAKEGWHAEVDLGLDWNDLGGSLHELFGGDAKDFRGDWLASIGWIETRGLPLQGSLTYGAKDRYEGRTDAFWLDDSGKNIREIGSNLDGTPITESNRTLLRTENRVHLGDATHLDLTAFRAGDAAVYSEFFRGDYRDRELPETALYLAHADDNRLFTLNGRFNLDEFAYRDNRSLSPTFTEELPVATFDWVAQPIATTPWDTPIVLDAATELGQRRTNFSDGALAPVGDRTFRADQSIEISAPFHLGVLNLRPFTSARFSFYDHDAAGEQRDRWAFGSGIQIGTRMSRTWSWLDDDGETHSLRHVVAPTVTWADVHHVDGRPTDFRRFDAIDALTEQNRVRFGVRNLLQRMDPPAKDKPANTYDFVYLDLMQNVWPDAGRDNDGETWGLFEYDFMIRPRAHFLPFSTFAFGVEGEHDWQRGMHTFNTELRVGKILGIDWLGSFRADEVARGAVGVGGAARMFGRWQLSANSQYDLDRKQWLTYNIGLDRIDHDWTIRAGVGYDPFTDTATFRIDFIPRLGGLLQPRDNSYFAGQRYDAGGTMTDF